MDIKLYGACNTITASIEDSKNVSIKLGKTGPVVVLESSKAERDLQKLDKAKDAEILDKDKDLEKLDEAEDLKKLDEAEDLKKLDEAEDLKKLDKAKESEKLDKAKGLETPDGAKKLKSPDKTGASKSLSEVKDMGKRDQVKDSKKAGKGKDLGKSDKAKGSKLTEKSKFQSTDEIKEKINRSKESVGKKSKKKQGDSLKKETKIQDPSLKTAKERNRITESKLAKDKAPELSAKLPVAGQKKRTSAQSSNVSSISSMKNTEATGNPFGEEKNISYEIPVLTVMDSTQDEVKRKRIPTAMYSDALKPARPPHPKEYVDHHRNCFPPLRLQKEPKKKPFIFSSQTTFVDRHSKCFPDFIFNKTFSTNKSKTHIKTYTEYHKNCVPKYPGEQNGRKRKMSVSEEVLSPATVKKTLLERHKNCIPVMDFKDTYFKTEEHKRKFTGSNASMSPEKLSLEKFINKFDTVIPSPKLPTGDQNIHTLPKTDDVESAAASKSASPMVEPEENGNEVLDTVIDDNKNEEDHETAIPSPNLSAGDENRHTLQETSENIEQPLLT